MVDLITLGDTTDHGGEVVTVSETMRYEDVRVVCKCDEVKCKATQRCATSSTFFTIARSCFSTGPIAASYNGSQWKKHNPDYAGDLDGFYNELK